MSQESSKLSNLDSFVDILKSTGYVEQTAVGWIGPTNYTVEKRSNFQGWANNVHYMHAQVTAVKVGCGVGSGGHYSEFYFDEFGKLILHGVWS